MRAKSTVQTWLNKGEKTIGEFGEKLDRDIEKRGWRSKISGFINEKKEKFFPKKNAKNVSNPYPNQEYEESKE